MARVRSTSPAHCGTDLNSILAVPSGPDGRAVHESLDAWVEQLLDSQCQDDGWHMIEVGQVAGDEQDAEARLTLANGCFGVRAAADVPMSSSHPAMFVAGLFAERDTEPVVPALVSVPDWLRLEAFVGDDLLTVPEADVHAYQRRLDLRHGILFGEWRQQTRAAGMVRVRSLRVSSLANRALTLHVFRLEHERSSSITLREGWPLEAAGNLALSGRNGRVWQPFGCSTALALATRAMPVPNDRQARSLVSGQRRTWSWARSPGPHTLVQQLALARGDPAVASARARRALRAVRLQGVKGAFLRHAAAWDEHWAASEVEVDGDPAAQRALRFAIYHLIGAVNPSDDRVSIGARSLTGRGYLGHVFWDTEMFLLPFYTLTWPAAARALLMYRYHTLGGARAKAARLGYRGALYAWESADSGAEATPPWAILHDGRLAAIKCGEREHHISADIAHAVWQYWHATHDVVFLLRAGAEILLETARFWASRVEREANAACHIRGVIGPDEYHDDVDDNAYTNGLARWNLQCALRAAELLESRWPGAWIQLSRRIGLDDTERADWHDVAQHLVTGFDTTTQLYEQFAGYFGLEDVDPSTYTGQGAPADVVLGEDRTRGSQVLKQADVLMLLALLPDRVDQCVQERNFRYYEPRCAQGSSLSPGVHALVAARIADLPRAQLYFEEAASIDLERTHGQTALGVHIGALGSLWQAAVLGYGGLQVGGQQLRLEPRLPPGWHRLVYRIRWRGRRLRVEVHQDIPEVSVTLERGRPLVMDIRGQRLRLTRGAETLTGD
jgi:trehalose/maltose hydrolase-like predicted phosphorylase